MKNKIKLPFFCHFSKEILETMDDLAQTFQMKPVITPLKFEDSA
jgi:hypothetical protein